MASRMNNSFYITKETFIEDSLSMSELVRFMAFLNIETRKICSHEGNKLYVCSDIYQSIRWRGHQLSEVWSSNCSIDNDLKSILVQVLYERSSTIETPSDSIVYGDADSSSSSGLITVRNRPNVCRYAQIFPKRPWYNFVLDYLYRNPSPDGPSFIDDVNQIMDNLYCIPRNKETICKIYDNFKIAILTHLSALNTHFRDAQKDSKNRSDALLRFTILCGLPENASLEGDATRKKDITFNFEDQRNVTVSLYFEPHLKLCYSDRYPGDTKYYYNRIYFFEGDHNMFGGKIIVGHIGEHL